MKVTYAIFSCAVAALCALLPAAQATAQDVTIRVDTPDFGIRIGNRSPGYYPPPVVVAPAPVYVPAPVYAPPPVVYTPPPTVIVPSPVYYSAPIYPRGRGRYCHPHKRHDDGYHDYRDYREQGRYIEEIRYNKKFKPKY